jgi:hypothetical protein
VEPSSGRIVISFLGAFTDNFVNPVVAALVLALVFLIRSPARSRMAAGGVGLLAGAAGIEAADPALMAAPAHLAGGLAAALLHAEIVLHFVLPACRLAKAVLHGTWAFLRGPTAAPGGGSVDDRPGGDDRKPTQRMDR